MDDFRIGSTSRYDSYHDEQAPADSKRKKSGRPKSEVSEDDVVLLEQSTEGTETEEGASAQDYYAPSEWGEESK
jgi:hypothetical protein